MLSARLRIIGAATTIGAVLVVGLGAVVRAETKYNPYTKKWEDASPDAVPQVNPMTGKWELAPPNARPKLNPYTNKYEMAPADARLELNTQTGTWQYVR